jgi:hypothetical protein
VPSGTRLIELPIALLAMTVTLLWRSAMLKSRWARTDSEMSVGSFVDQRRGERQPFPSCTGGAARWCGLGAPRWRAPTALTRHHLAVERIFWSYMVAALPGRETRGLPEASPDTLRTTARGLRPLSKFEHRCLGVAAFSYSAVLVEQTARSGRALPANAYEIRAPRPDPAVARHV